MSRFFYYYAECINAECIYVEFGYAQYRYAERRGTISILAVVACTLGVFPTKIDQRTEGWTITYLGSGLAFIKQSRILI